MWEPHAGGSPAGARLLLLENYAQLQRPEQALLRAVSRAGFWQSFGIVVQARLSLSTLPLPVLVAFLQRCCGTRMPGALCIC